MTAHRLLALGQAALTPGQQVIFDAAIKAGLPVRSCACGLVLVGDADGVDGPWSRHTAAATRTRSEHPSLWRKS